jgi:hypothetical protein
VKTDAHQLVPRLRIRGPIPPLPIRLHGTQKNVAFLCALILISTHRPIYLFAGSFWLSYCSEGKFVRHTSH